MPSAKLCDECGRKIASWVSELGYTLGHRKKNYCRFCFLKLRSAGKIKERQKDNEFLAAVNWELQLVAEKKRRDAHHRTQMFIFHFLPIQFE